MHAALRAGLGSLALALGLTGGAVHAETVSVTRAQAILVGRAAYLDGNAALADAVARQLVQANPQDVEALLLLSASEQALGHASAGYDYGQRAWAVARAARKPRILRYEIARQTAHAAMAGNRLSAAGRWLRRSMTVAPDPATKAQSAADLAHVVAATPLTFSGSFQVSPTDNVNHGAATGLLAIDTTVIGGISGWSVARAGYLAAGQLTATRNLGVTASGKARNSLSFGLSGVLHWLTASETRANPDLRAHDLDYYSATAGWTHEIALPGHNRPLSLTAEVEQTWYDGQPYAPTLRGKVDYALPHMGTGNLILSAVLERQWQDAPSGVVNGTNLSLAGDMPVAALGSHFGYGLGATFLRSAWSNTTYDAYDAHLSLTPDARLGPFRVSVGIGGTWSHYAEYSLGFANVTKGRTDQGFWTRATFGLPDVSVWGMVPSVSLRHEQTISNISKYHTNQTALYFGLAANF